MEKLSKPFISIILFALMLSVQAQNNTNAQRQTPAPEQMSEYRRVMDERLRNDWAYLARYKEDNQKIGDPAPNEDRVVFYGNSITDFWINFRPDFFQSKPYIDRGISGQTTPQMLVRFRQDVIDLKPKVVVILAGINDIAGNTGPSTLEMIENNLQSMSEIAKSNNIKVVFCSVLPCNSINNRPDLQPAEKVVQLNAWIKRYASENGCIYVDYFSKMTDGKDGLIKEYTEDGLHPNSVGYSVMEPLVQAGIKKALER